MYSFRTGLNLFITTHLQHTLTLRGWGLTRFFGQASILECNLFFRRKSHFWSHFHTRLPNTTTGTLFCFFSVTFYSFRTQLLLGGGGFDVYFPNHPILECNLFLRGKTSIWTHFDTRLPSMLLPLPPSFFSVMFYSFRDNT